MKCQQIMWGWSGGSKRRVEGERILNANNVLVYYSLRQTVSVLMICSTADPRHTSVSFTPHQILLLVPITTCINNAKFPLFFFNRIPPLSLLPSLPLPFLLSVCLNLWRSVCFTWHLNCVDSHTPVKSKCYNRGLGIKWNNVQCFLPFCLLFIQLWSCCDFLLSWNTN